MSTKPRVAPYGSWKSPITSDLIVSQTINLGEIVLEGEQTYWLERRPAEKGRSVVVHRPPAGEPSDGPAAAAGTSGLAEVVPRTKKPHRCAARK